MPRMFPVVAPLLLVATTGLLAACSRAPDTPGTLDADDQRQLNEAAAMLDANSVEANAVAPQAEPAG